MFRQRLIETANAIGADPLDLATVISYETGGTFNPTQAGPTTQWGQHRGLIQFGEPQARQHGVDWNDPLNSQLGPDGAVASYLRSSGYKPGMGLLDLYSTINAGAPGLYNRSDANNGGAPGTVRDKVQSQMAGHRQNAMRILGNEGGQQMRQPTRTSTRGTPFVPQQRGGSAPMSFPQDDGKPPVARGQQIAQAAALAFNQLRSDPDPNLSGQFESQNEQSRARQVKNRTVEWLRSQGREDLAGAVENGTIGARDAFIMTQQRAAPPGTKVINGRLVNETTGEVIGDYRDAPEQYRQVPGSELGLAGELADRLFNIAPDGKVTQVGGSGQTINVGQGEGAFDKETGKILAQEAAEVVAQGAQAQRSMAQINTLEQALANAPSGAGGALLNVAANLGIKTEGSSDVEVANAIISQLVPAQRPPGSGVMSDADLEMFRQSLPRLINTREGNARIIETMRGIAEYDMKRGQIARQLQLGQITPQQASQAYQALGNPLSGFREQAQVDGGGDASTQNTGNTSTSIPDFKSMTDEELDAYIERGGGQ